MTQPTWRQSDGSPISCAEKIKQLNENFLELRQIAQDALEDALLMGCDEEQIKSTFQDIMHELENPFSKKNNPDHRTK